MPIPILTMQVEARVNAVWKKQNFTLIWNLPISLSSIKWKSCFTEIFGTNFWYKSNFHTVQTAEEGELKLQNLDTAAGQILIGNYSFFPLSKNGNFLPFLNCTLTHSWKKQFRHMKNYFSIHDKRVKVVKRFSMPLFVKCPIKMAREEEKFLLLMGAISYHLVGL